MEQESMDVVLVWKCPQGSLDGVTEGPHQGVVVGEVVVVMVAEIGQGHHIDEGRRHRMAKDVHHRHDDDILEANHRGIDPQSARSTLGTGHSRYETNHLTGMYRLRSLNRTPDYRELSDDELMWRLMKYK